MSLQIDKTDDGVCQFDSVQIVSFYSAGRITMRTGIVSRIEIREGYVLPIISTTNSNFTKAILGKTIKENNPHTNKRARVRFNPVTKRQIMTCRIVLIEKSMDYPCYKYSFNLK